uniref:SfiI-subtelomeric related protein family member, putative n=1 Tax=Theileria annulata TaxID=5874 RepID=A0A3B0N6P2_THEAN
MNNIKIDKTCAGQGSQSPNPESQPKSSSSATDQSSSGTGESQECQSTSTNPVTSVNKVTLDIEKNESTSEFDYSKDDKIYTFTVKDSHVFNKVTKETDEVWDSKEGECGTKVIFIDENDKYVSILLTNNMFKLFHLVNNEWKDITSDRADVTNLKFFSNNDTELKSSDFKVTIVDYSYEFTFNAGVKCMKIKYADDDVWKNTDDSEFAEITAFDLGLLSNTFFVKRQNKFKKLEFKPAQSKAGTKGTYSTGTGTGTDGTLVTLDISQTENTDQCEYSKDGKIHTFAAKPGHVVNKVTKGTDVVWDSKEGECGTKVVFIDEHDKYVSILLQSNGFVFYILSDDGTWTDITDKRHDITRLKFYGDGDSGISQSDYTVTIVDYAYEYKFNTEVSCKKIKYADDDIWKDTDDSEFADITAFDLALPSNTFFVKKESKFKKLDFEPTQTHKKARHTELISSTEPVPEKVAVTVLAPTGKPRAKKTPEVVAGHRTAITLNISEKASNSAIEFKEDYLKNVMIYSAKEKYVFNKIVMSSSGCCGSKCCEFQTVFWKAKDESQYFHRVYIDGLGTFSRTSNLSIHLCNGNFIHFNKPGSGFWSQSPGVVDLDVRISNSNIKVDYFMKNNFRIYVAKPGYTIRKVVKSKKCSSDCCGSPKVIWEADKEHALKVVLMGSKKEPKHVAVLLKNGELNLLFKSGSGKPWEDITSTKNNIIDLKMYTMVEGNKYMELHGDHYSITLFNEFYGYLLYEGVDCHLVKHNDRTIWDHREEREFGCLKGVFLDLKSNKFNVMNDNDNYWLSEEVRKVNPITLDISSKASTDDFDFTVDHNRNIMIYTSKGNAIFNQVKDVSLVWETFEPQRYSTKVFVDKSGHNVSIYLMNGQILHFGRSEGGKWLSNPSKIILDLDKTSSTIGYDFVHHGESRTFTAKSGYEFKTVMVSNTFSKDHTFWEAEKDEEYSTKVTVYGVETNVRNINIFMNNNEIKHFHKANKKWVTTTPIVLDIESNTDNDLFEYRSTRNFGHFNPKPNLTIEKIVKSYKSNPCVSTCFGSTCCGSIDELVIWTAQPEDHGLKAVLMGSGKDEKYMSILLQSRNFVLLRKCGKGECWEDITKEKSDFSGIKMYSLEEGTSNYHELTETDYDPIIFESRYGYEFKDGVKCVKITYNNTLLWSHTDDPEFGYLKGLYLDLPKDQFSVTNLKDQTKHLTKAKITKVTLDINKKVSTSEFKHSKSRNFHKYTTKFCRVFSKVVQGTTDIWDSKDDVYGNSVGVRTKDDQNYVVVLLDNGNFVLLQESGGNWTDITSSRFDVKLLKFYSKSDDELTSSNYTVELLGHYRCFTISYVFDRGPKCKSVIYGYDTVWDENSCCSYKTIQRFDFDPISNIFYAVKNCCEWKKIDYKPTPETAAMITKVSVTKPAEPTKVTLDIEKTESTDEFDYTEQNGVVTYKPKDDHLFSKVSHGTKDIWESKDNIFGTLVRTKVSKDVKFLVVLLDNNMFTLFELVGGEWKDITTERHDITEIKFFGEGDTEITKTDYTVSIVDLSFTYLFNSGVSCKTIKLGEDEIWKHTDDSKFADIKSFSLGLASNSFFVKNQSDDVKKIEEKAEPPEEKAEAKTEEPEEKTEEPEATPPATTPETQQETTPTEESSTPEPEPEPETTPVVTKVDLDIQNTQSTSQFDYSDKNGIVTYSVKSGHGFNKVSKGTIVVWESTDHHGTLVRTKLFSNNERFLAIIFYNNSFKLFRQSEGDTSWQDITNTRRDVAKLKFLSHNDHEFTNVEFTVSFVDFFYIYKFNTGVRCKKIMLGEGELWTNTDDPLFSEIKSLSLDLPTNKFIVTNLKDQTKELTIPNITIDSLDVQNTQTTTEFDYSRSSDFHKYNPKSGYVFSKVSEGTTVIWESKDNLYGTQVMFIEGVKYLAVLLQNNNFVLFEHHNDKWHDITSKRHDVTKVKFFGDDNVELTKSDYNASFVDFFYRLKFNTNVKCRKITYNNIELWKHTDDPKFSEIMLFSMGLASNSFFVKSISGYCKKLPETAEPTQQATEAEESEQQSAESEESTEAEDPATPAEPAESNQPEEHDSSEQSIPDPSSASSS